jgi:hypothetical protein
MRHQHLNLQSSLEDNREKLFGALRHNHSSILAGNQGLYNGESLILIPKNSTEAANHQVPNTNRVSRFMFKNEQQQRNSGFANNPNRIVQAPISFNLHTRPQ